jgi:hypothetical protein
MGQCNIQVIPFVENDTTLFPSHEFSQPPPVVIDEEDEYFVDHILDKCKRGHGIQYLIQWTGYGPEDDHWLPSSSLADCEALDIWLARRK